MHYLGSPLSMFKKATSFILGVMIATAPVAVSAQALPSIPPNASIEQLQQIIAQLTLILQQLLEQRAPRPECSISYSPSTIGSTGTSTVSWAGTASTTRTYTLARDGVVFFGPQSTTVSGNGTVTYAELGGPGVITRTDTISGRGGTNTCTGTLTVSPLPLVVTPSARVVTPNGGEQLTLGATTTITLALTAVQSYSIALYRNDQWFASLVQDASASSQQYSWTPSASVLGTVDTHGQVFKIHVTARKTDNSGYVTDASDAPFRFVSGTLPATTPSCTISYAPTTIASGSVVAQWGSTNATSRSYMLYKDGALYFGPQSTSVSGSGSFSSDELGAPGTITRVDSVAGPGGTAECRAEIVVTAPVVSTPTAPTCTITYQPSAIGPGQTLAVSWTSASATSRTYSLSYNGAQYFGPHTIALSGTASYPYSELSDRIGQITRTDTVTGPGGSAQCTATLSVSAQTTAQAPGAQSIANLASALAALEASLKSFLAR